MKAAFQICNSIFLLFFYANISFAQAAQTQKLLAENEAIKLSKQIIQQFMDENKVPGMSAAVAIDGKIIWSEGFGYADLENGVPATKHTRFRIASISKPITSAALALLYEKGSINIDEPIQKYIRDFPPKRWDITIRMLASHQAGVRAYLGNEFLNNKHFDSVAEGVDIFRNDTLIFKPGTDYSYTSYGYNLLSEIIEKVSGTEYLSFMQQNIFNPLGMRSIIADHTDSLISHRSSFYSISETGNVINSPFVDNSNKWAGGGFISNSEDLVRFGNALLSNKFLKKETLELFTTPLKPANGKETDYGLGWFTKTDNFGFRWFGHSGGAMGGRSMLIIYPDDNIVIALVTNLGPAKAPVDESHIIANFFRTTLK